MMKDYIIKSVRIAVLFAAVALSGCKGFLQIDNPSSVTDEYYNTVEGQQRLITDMFSRCRDLYSVGELQYFGTDMYMAVSESPNEKMFNGYDKTFNSTAGVVAPYWNNLYKMVQEANTLVARCTPEVAGTKYESLMAQGKFFRALAYYYLVETFGPVPLFIEENKGVITSATRAEEKVIYKFIIDELNSIVDVLPMKATGGDLSNAAVLQFAGKVYLTRAYKPFAETSDFQMAATLLDRIINDPAKSYTMLDKFADVFAEDNQGNSEVIWAIQYGNDKNYIGNGNPEHLLFGFNISALRPDLFGYVQADYSAQQRGYWVIPQVHEWYTDPVVDSRYDATFKREYYINNPNNEDLGKLGLYFPRWNDESGDDKGAVESFPFKKKGEYVWYPNSTAMTVLEGGSDFLPMVKKFKETKIQWNGKGEREDIVMRVADTYLLSAEAHLGAGATGIALDRLNEVRKRAALSDADKVTMTLDAIDLDVVLDERGRELLGEHDRWFDLKRTGKLIERAKKYNIFVAHYNNINQNHLVRPIPQDERNKVEGLTQNAGY